MIDIDHNTSRFMWKLEKDIKTNKKRKDSKNGQHIYVRKHGMNMMWYQCVQIWLMIWDNKNQLSSLCHQLLQNLMDTATNIET